jgi:hypothetical protein
MFMDRETVERVTALDNQIHQALDDIHKTSFTQELKWSGDFVEEIDGDYGWCLKLGSGEVGNIYCIYTGRIKRTFQIAVAFRSEVVESSIKCSLGIVRPYTLGVWSFKDLLEEGEMYMAQTAQPTTKYIPSISDPMRVDLSAARKSVGIHLEVDVPTSGEFRVYGFLIEYQIAFQK